MALYRSPEYETSFVSISSSVHKRKFNIDFQDGGHLGFLIRTILANFELQVTSILPMNFVSVGLLIQNTMVGSN